MAQALVKGVVAVGLVAGITFTAVGQVFPAAKPTPKAVHVVAFYNQSVLVAQGLTPTAALRRARRFAPYPLTSVSYLPRGFQLAIVRMYPYIPNYQQPQDTLTYYKLIVTRGRHSTSSRALYFELDHQYGQPYVYPAGNAFYTVSTTRAGSRLVSIAEQKYTDLRHHKAVDQLFVYWFDKKVKVATEVTAELTTSGLTRADVLKIAASVR